MKRFAQLTFVACLAFAFSVTNNLIYYFKDGTLVNAGGTAYNHTIDPIAGTNNCSLSIGEDCALTSNFYWSGNVGDVRLSNEGIYSANYTPSVWPINYVTDGYAYSPVFDMASAGGLDLSVTATIPAGCSVTKLYRSPSSISDKSITAGDFSTFNKYGRYHQFALHLTGSGTNTPTVTQVLVK